jgi:hypothetical protein
MHTYIHTLEQYDLMQMLGLTALPLIGTVHYRHSNNNAAVRSPNAATISNDTELDVVVRNYYVTLRDSVT